MSFCKILLTKNSLSQKIESVLEKILNIIERLSAIIQGVIVFLVFLFLHLLL